MEYIVSVDGGGTKTALCALNISNMKRFYLYTGCTNFKSIGIEKTKDNLKNGICKLMSTLNISKEDVKLWILGLSGNDSNYDYTILMDMLKSIELDRNKVYLCNDSELAFHSSGNLPGIIVIAGTGSIVTGFDAPGRNIRIGGWGYNISDLGSGYWIGCEAVKYLLLYCDHCYGFYPIFDKLKEFYNQDDFNKLKQYITSLSECYNIAANAKLVIEYAEQGEILCNKIVNEAIGYLSLQVSAAYEKLGFSQEISVDIVMGGGLFKNEFFFNKMKDILIDRYSIKNAKFVTINNEPVDGGIKIALSKLNKVSEIGSVNC